MESRPLLLGHRGARGEKSIPENTLASFDLALAQGCDGFEFDVRLSGDAQAVICHDAAVRGMKLASHTATELALPRLREVLERYQRTAFLDIELKVAGGEALTVELRKKFYPAGGFVVSSFLPGCLQALHALDATVPLGLIGETRDQLRHWRELPVEYVIPQFALVRQDLVADLKAAGKKILVWTVNLPDDMERFAQWGVDGIISDNPKLLADTFKSHKSPR